MAIGGMYKVNNPMETAMMGMGNASKTYASMTKKTKTETKPPKKTAGGAIQNAGGAALVGWQMGNQFTTGGSAATETAAPLPFAEGAPVTSQAVGLTETAPANASTFAPETASQVAGAGEAAKAGAPVVAEAAAPAAGEAAAGGVWWQQMQ